MNSHGISPSFLFVLLSKTHSAILLFCYLILMGLFVMLMQPPSFLFLDIFYLIRKLPLFFRKGIGKICGLNASCAVWLVGHRHFNLRSLGQIFMRKIIF